MSGGRCDPMWQVMLRSSERMGFHEWPIDFFNLYFVVTISCGDFCSHHVDLVNILRPARRRHHPAACQTHQLIQVMLMRMMMMMFRCRLSSTRHALSQVSHAIIMTLFTSLARHTCMNTQLLFNRLFILPVLRGCIMPWLHHARSAPKSIFFENCQA